jgi:alkanesulfonate monooxygenase SsuD/methylene tetrahydromethanopterin reductase-like flavin-dependent oxidoreductase (luciferase family)
MHAGLSLVFQNLDGHLTDAEMYRFELGLAARAEAVGFDSVWTPEHHFGDYQLTPNVPQFLAWVAGQTTRVKLGTMVTVLPWHDPVRVAEQIALLDLLCGGRCLFGFGRGAASVEYEGFRVPMEEARPRFVEAAQIVVAALRGESFAYDGQFYKIPRTAIRPRPISHPERRFYASAVSPDSAEIMAKLGFGLLMVMQNEWAKASEDIVRYREIATEAGHAPRPPIILTNVCCAESRDEAHERAFKYLGQKWQSIDDHYHFSDGHLATVKGYESYGKMARTYAKIGESAETRKKATDFYVGIQIVGTPRDCLEKIAELQSLTGLDHLVTEYSFGAMPHEEAELNMRLFADAVLPVLQRDPAFAGGGLPGAAPAPSDPEQERLFAPA